MIRIKNIFFYVVAALALHCLSTSLESQFLPKFLHHNIVNILINLLAINTLLTGIVLTKTKEVSENHENFDFNKGYKELKYILLKQMILIGLSIIALIFKDSLIIKAGLVYYGFIIDTIIIAIFINTLGTLYDTGRAIFLISKK